MRSKKIKSKYIEIIRNIHENVILHKSIFLFFMILIDDIVSAELP